MFLSEWREFPLASNLAGEKKKNLTALVSMLLTSRASLTCFGVVSFLVGLSTYQHPGIYRQTQNVHCVVLSQYRNM